MDRDRIRVSGRPSMTQRMEVDDFVSQSLLIRIHDRSRRESFAQRGKKEEGTAGVSDFLMGYKCRV